MKMREKSPQKGAAKKDGHKRYYALGLHMHQPPDNMDVLINHNEWEAQQIIYSYNRAVRYAHLTQGDGCFHVGFSGILLEQFKDPRLIERYRRFIDIPHMIKAYRQAENIEIIGMGYYHPIFPLIPQEDWEEQLQKGRDIVQELFGQQPKGFWPSEMAFSMEMIPYLKKAGYEYVVVDHVHVKPVDEDGPADPFCPYLAEYAGCTITVIPRHRDISNAQESGLNPAWFNNEVDKKIKESPSPDDVRLLTTWSDGENGGWFRQMDDNAGFWGYFYYPLLNQIKQGSAPIEMIKISDFVRKYPPQKKATVRTGAWNVGSTSGFDFAQWNGSEDQKEAIKVLFEVSGRYWELQKNKLSGEKAEQLRHARQLVLDAETSCYLFWGRAWLPKMYDKLQAAQECLARI